MAGTQSRIQISFRVMCLSQVDIFNRQKSSPFSKKSCLGLKTKAHALQRKDQSGILLSQLQQESHEYAPSKHTGRQIDISSERQISADSQG